MRDNLPNKVYDTECAIVNLDSVKNSGTHWVCYYKFHDLSYYFDSFGLNPPIELEKYLGNTIIGSSFQVQQFNTNYCGYLCLYILSGLSKGFKFNDLILNLID